jgi:hypothetical protein
MDGWKLVLDPSLTLSTTILLIMQDMTYRRTIERGRGAWTFRSWMPPQSIHAKLLHTIPLLSTLQPAYHVDNPSQSTPLSPPPNQGHSPCRPFHPHPRPKGPDPQTHDHVSS